MSELLLRELAAFGGDGAVITPGHAAYEHYRKVWNGVIDRHPAAICRPRTVDEVRRAVRAASSAKALLAVRGGGHSFPGLSTCDHGLVIALSQLNSVEIDASARTVEVGGGALLGDLDRAAVPLGFVVPAGVISHTGVAGLTLGGGMGWCCRRYGLTIDSLLGAEIVTADGRVLWASETSEPELFWAIRGGGGNFGIATRFKFKLHPLGSIIAGQWTYPFSELGPAIAALHDLASNRPREFSIAFTVTTSGLSLTAIWSGDEGLAEAMLAPFGRLSASGQGGIRHMPYLELQSRNDEHFAWSRRYYSKGGFWSAVTDQSIKLMIEEIKHAPTPDCEIYVQQLGGAISDVPEETSAYSGRAANYYWIVEPVWDDPALDETCVAWGRSTGNKLADRSIAGNYVNEQGDADSEVVLSAYGGAKYQRLARLKARLDPENLFRLNQNIKPQV